VSVLAKNSILSWSGEYYIPNLVHLKTAPRAVDFTAFIAISEELRWYEY